MVLSWILVLDWRNEEKSTPGIFQNTILDKCSFSNLSTNAEKPKI